MINLSLTEQQFNYLFKLLDSEIRAKGLSVLPDVVEFNNVLMAAARDAREVQELDESQRSNTTITQE